MADNNDYVIAQEIYERYKDMYGSNTQGLCAYIAKDIINAIGGIPTAGYITWFGGSCRREHWWVEKNGLIIDPMGDDRLGNEVGYRHEKVHQDLGVFMQMLNK